jgi:hypothetical protein
MFYKSVADSLAFFSVFEKHFSFWYLIPLVIIFCLLAFKARKDIFKQVASLNWWPYVFIVFLVTVVMLKNYGFFDDSNDSRSEDYKIAAKFYAIKQEYMVCHYGKGNDCFAEATMEKAPGYSFLLSWFFRLFGVSSQTALAFSLLLALAAPIILFFTLLVITGRLLISFPLALLFALNKKFIEYATQTEVVMITIFFIIVSLFFAAVYYKSGNRELLMAAACSFLLLGYVRAEYLLLFAVFLLFNWKEFFSIGRVNRLFSLVLAVLFIFLILHSLTEMPRHADSNGNYLVASKLYERIPSKAQAFLFRQHYVFLIPVLAFSLLWLRKPKTVAFFALVHLILFSALILMFQNDYLNNYFAPLLPSLFVGLGAGAQRLCLLDSKYASKRCYFAYPIFLFLLLAFFFFSLPYTHAGFEQYSVRSFDDLMNGIDKGVVFTHTQPITSRLLLRTNLTVVLTTDPRRIRQFVSDDSYLVSLKSEFHAHEVDAVLNSFNMTVVRESQGVWIYKFEK